METFHFSNAPCTLFFQSLRQSGCLSSSSPFAFPPVLLSLLLLLLLLLLQMPLIQLLLPLLLPVVVPRLLLLLLLLLLSLLEIVLVPRLLSPCPTSFSFSSLFPLHPSYSSSCACTSVHGHRVACLLQQL